MRIGTQGEFGKVTSNAHVTKRYLYHGNPRGNNQQTVVFCYMGAEVAWKVSKYRSNKMLSTDLYVNPLFLGGMEAEYDKYLSNGGNHGS